MSGYLCGIDIGGRRDERHLLGRKRPGVELWTGGLILDWYREVRASG